MRKHLPNRVLAIIPARGGSKGIPRKNIRLLNGKPLVAYSIQHAVQSQAIERVVVSTDDDEIASAAAHYGAEVLIRPAELATDDTPTLSVIQHVLRTLDLVRVYQKIVILQPTSPLRTGSQVAEAISLLTSSVDAVMSVCLAEHSPYKMYCIENERLVPFVEGAAQGIPRQRLPAVYRENGAIYVSWRYVIEHGSIIGNLTRPFIMDWQSSLDIDTEIDWQIAELIVRQREQAV